MLEGSQNLRAGRLPWSYAGQTERTRFQQISYDDLVAMMVIFIYLHFIFLFLFF